MAQIGVHRHSRRCDLVKRIKKYRTLLLMLIPGLLLVFVFNYIPMVGLGLA
ncbi:MAG TPA: sugar ABC transporter permease, partial [Candidatus Alectryocaccomicrobium excrementavium]|nr:sugar ABC transporter permease [Candidatus Alectryocaccomicrobium excrementavium]